MIVLQLFWLFVIVACLTFFFVFVNKTKSMFSTWRPFPVFAAVTILLNLCLYALVPVYSNNAWQNPKLVKCTETSSRNILALSFTAHGSETLLKVQTKFICKRFRKCEVQGLRVVKSTRIFKRESRRVLTVHLRVVESTY